MAKNALFDHRPVWLIPAVTGIVTTLVGLLLQPVSMSVSPAVSGDLILAAEIREVIDDPGGFLSLSVVRIEGGSDTYAAVGAAEPGGDKPIASHDLVELGSITKTFNGLLLADAVGRGEVTSSDPVSEYLPELSGTPVGTTTLAELARHTSGLPSMPPAREVLMTVGGVFNTDLLDGESVDGMIADAARLPIGETRGEYAYSNLGAALLGWALTSAAGEADWSELVSKRVLEPLGMNSTVFARDRNEVPKSAIPGHLAGGIRATPTTSLPYMPAGCCTWTTAEDMAVYAQALIDGSAPGGEALGSTSLASQTAAADRIHGYHWFTSSDNNLLYDWHNGATLGYFTMLAVSKQADAAVFIAGNAPRPVDAVALELLGDPEQTTFRPTLTVGWAVLAITTVALIALTVVAFRTRARTSVVSATSLAVVSLVGLHAYGPWAAVPSEWWALLLGTASALAAFGLQRVHELPKEIGWKRSLGRATALPTTAFALICLGWWVVQLSG